MIYPKSCPGVEAVTFVDGAEVTVDAGKELLVEKLDIGAVTAEQVAQIISEQNPGVTASVKAGTISIGAPPVHVNCRTVSPRLARSEELMVEDFKQRFQRSIGGIIAKPKDADISKLLQVIMKNADGLWEKAQEDYGCPGPRPSFGIIFYDDFIRINWVNNNG